MALQKKHSVIARDAGESPRKHVGVQGLAQAVLIVDSLDLRYHHLVFVLIVLVS